MRAINKTPRGRAGFSLVELLIVIVVIAILASFLLGAVNSARLAAREAAVIQDIKGLEKAIADFKAQFGVEPPSFITLYEQGTSHLNESWAKDDSVAWRNAARRSSRAAIREMWPQFDFSQDVDINCDGAIKSDGPIILNGAECLAFFLGGMQEYKDLDGDNVFSDFQGARGFSSNPALPFSGFSTTGTSFGGNRIGPFLDIDPGRLVDIDSDRIHEYIDSFPGQVNPIQYFSSYGGQGYRPGGMDASTPLDDESVYLGSTQTLRSVYMQGAGTATQPGVPYKENGFQLISPGFDGDYGFGGLCDSEKGCLSAASDPAGRDATVILRERDNITNFKGGRIN